MIYIDEYYPEGSLKQSFSVRDVTIRRNVDAKQLYEVIGEIGRGKFGTVYKCKEKSTELQLAAKFVPIPRREDRRNVEREVEIMNLLQHSLIIQLYAAYEYQKMMCVVLELIEGGELFDRVVNDDFVLTERVCAVFMRQVCEAMQFIHKNNILHLDLKPENILCLTKTGNRIKIIDFGLARKYDPDKKLQILFGTPEFVAPEVVNFDCISYGTDMWSVGVICYVLLSGLSPFMGETDIETMANVTIAKYDFDDAAFNNVSPEALDFISKLLKKDMSSRITASECLEHKWLEKRSRSITSSPKKVIASNKNITIKSIETISNSEEDLSKYSTPSLPPLVSSEQPTPSILQPSVTVAKQSPPPIKISLTPPLLPEKSSEKPSEDERKEEKTITNTDQELLDLTKDNLKMFIERWENHPNSPYVFDTSSYSIAPTYPFSEGLNNNYNNIKNSKNGSSNVSSRVCSPSPCESINNLSDEITSQADSSLMNMEIIDKNTFDTNDLIIKDYLQSFDRRNSDTNYLLGRRPSGESRINLADEIRKLSDHLLMLAEINSKLGKENQMDDEPNNISKQNQKSSSSTLVSEKLETIQESNLLNPNVNDINNQSPLDTTTVKSTLKKKSTSVIDSTSSKITSSSPSLSKVKSHTTKTKKTIKPSLSSSSTSVTKTSEATTLKPTDKKLTKISTLSVSLQQSLDETPRTYTSLSSSSSSSISTSSKIKSNNLPNSNEGYTTKLANGFKKQFLSISPPSNSTSGVPWPITNKRTKFRINQMSRDVPIGSPDTHQPIDLEDAANTTKDCLLHLLEKYNERTIIRNNAGRTGNTNGPIGRHQSISVDWNNLSDNLEYQSISSINAFFRRHPSKGNCVKQLQAQLEAKTKTKK